jgi:hypothetical protein
MFRDGCTNVHNEERSSQPSVEWWSCSKCWQKNKMCERRHFTISELSCDFHRFNTLFSIRLSQLG